MLTFARCHPEHIALIEPQAVQSLDARALQAPDAAELISSSISLSAWFEHRCIAAAGIIDMWTGRSTAWALFAPGAAQHMWAITRKVRFVLDRYPARRIEMTVVTEHEKGHRWAEMLGFEREALMKAYLPDGRDVVQYVRLNA